MNLILLLPIIATMLWASSNFIDKYLISRYFKSKQGALILYSAFIGLPICILIFLFNPNVIYINLITAVLIILNSFLYILYLFPYLSALNKADTSSVAPIFQTIPIFTYILALIFLKEQLSLNQIIAGLLIIIGSVGISMNFKKGFLIRKKVLGLMLLASFIVSLNWLFFKFFAIELDFWKVSFWQYLGFFLFAIILFIFNKKYQKDFLETFRTNKTRILSLNALNEVLNITAVIIFSYATLLAPLALVSVLNGLQPFFTLIFGVLLSIFFPNIIKEEIGRRVLIYKALSIIIIFVGVYFLQGTI